jgi:hypothetical protein
MSDQTNSNSDIIISGSIATWELKEEGKYNGTYVGTFKFKCFLSPTAKIYANREYRELLGVNPVMAGEHESFLAYALTQLKHRIIESPPFWTSTLQSSSFAGDIPDENIITKVLDAAIRSEVKYAEELKSKRDKVIQKAKKLAEKVDSELNEEKTEDKLDE